LTAPLVCLLLLAAPVTVAPGNPYLTEARKQVRELEETHALETLVKARALHPADGDEQAQIELTAGLAYAGLARREDAIERFVAALTLRPSVTLPPNSSPRVEEWWRVAVSRALPRYLPVNPPAGTAVVTAPAPARSRPTVTWLPVALASTGLAALTAGVVLGINANNAAAGAQRAESVGAAQKIQGTANARATDANILFAAAGGLAIGAGFAFAFR
jgi:hypothetical protein